MSPIMRRGPDSARACLRAARRARCCKISEGTHRVLKQLAVETGWTFEQVIDDALSLYQRERLLRDINAGFAALRADPTAWAAECAEREAWDATLADGASESRA